ncbi:hypothetical protein ALI22I_39140 [Saccharothrix sp. ALI-22-I]|nr:hypothetical protein ALI22I_39140 [Saccharothrix sp. ALI-22-I]
MRGAPTLVRVNIVLPVVLGLIGVAFGTIGFLGVRGQLHRNRYFGVRTKATLRDDETFALANKIAGVPNAAAGAIALVAAGAAAVNPALMLVIGIVGLIGSVVVAGAGGVLGHRAAEAMPEQAPAGCGGCACSGSGGACGVLTRA